MWKHLFKKYWFSIIAAPIFMCGEVVVDLLQPRFMSIIIDEGVLGVSNHYIGNLHLVIVTGMQMIGLVLCGVISAIISGIFAHSCGQKFGNDIRKMAFHKVMSLSFAQIEKIGTSSIVTRIINDISQIQQLVRMSISAFVRTLLLFAGGIGFMLTLDFHFGLVVLAVLPLIAICITVFMRKTNEVFLELQKKIDVVNNIVQENVSGSRVVKAYVKEEYEKERFGRANEDLVETQLRALLFIARMTPIMNIVLNIAVVFIIKIGAIQVEAGGVTPGNVMAAITYITQILNAVMGISMIFQTVSRGIACSRRVQAILDCEPDIRDGTCTQKSTVYGKIEFQNVSFSYPDMKEERVIRNFNFTINSGETIGILGSTGAGKSSLIQLIPRFFDTTEGKILIDDINVKEYSLRDLRDKISFVFQHSEIFSDTIENNILWGNKQASAKEVEKAAEIAQAKEFILAKEKGFQTEVSQQGNSLSGGQKQRVAISRAVLKKSEILIFDDSTSALDLKTEADLYESLQRECPNSTKIIIAQRIASVRNADRIIVLEEGQLNAVGTHEELLRSSEIYQDIYNSQLKIGGTVHGRP
ncbi:MAG: ABC transporter ATP-binding protein [Eubacteriales bacterium]|nr:ABC transporter ATP-binding protein [Eubacteriales bacterium]